MKQRIVCAALLALVPLASLAGDLALKIDNETVTLSRDGVTRITRFSERLIRRDEQSWRQPIVPDHASHQEDEVEHKGHKHANLDGAAHWVERTKDGKLRVRAVDMHEKRIVEVGAADYGNIGFDGKWTTAKQLLDPAQLKQMKPSTKPAPEGARWYEVKKPNMTVRVLWDEKEEYPRRIESVNSFGTYRSTLVATREAMPANMPWTQLKGYSTKDYVDLLD